jgi:hypothetical protein
MEVQTEGERHTCTSVAMFHQNLITFQHLSLNLGFVIPCVFKYSNKTPQPDATVSRQIYCVVAQTLLNMLRALLCPSSGVLSNCSRSLRFPYKCRGGCVSSRGQLETQICRLPTDKNTKHAQMTYTCGHILRNNTNSTNANQQEE